jgi:Kdo2-lipid IVA lauroyltransferase/acyltransferase
LAKSKSTATVRVEYALARLVTGALRFLPERIAYFAARVCTKLLDLGVPKLRRVARTNLSFACPELEDKHRERIIDGVFKSLARVLVAFSRFPDLNPDNIGNLIRYEGLEHYQRAKAKGRGILVATAHLGNWELSAFAHAFMTEPMGVMVRPLDNPLIDGLVERYRGLSGNKLIFKRDSALSVVRALKNNEAVGILIDQNTTPAEGVFIDFFGKRACAGAAFAKLAAKTGATVIPGFAFWHEDEERYVLRFYPEIQMSGDAQADTQHIHGEIERIIRRYPDQWMWIHRRWKTRPPGEAALY